MERLLIMGERESIRRTIIERARADGLEKLLELNESIDQATVRPEGRGSHNLPRISDANDPNERNRSELRSIDIKISSISTHLSVGRAG